MKVLLVPLLVMVFASGTAYGQRQKYDSTYYQSYTNLLTSRFYFSKKSTSLKLRDREEDFNLTYRPNTTLNMGVGATYKGFTLNLAYGFGFLNPEKDWKAKAKAISFS